ncbi:TraR/DksA family transcriptional regulator [Pseudobythopirellula maris]|uniref:TraR/DksA family transcriptional regulator n=1 Tax=Pseudobythopirellula maris TaxID=2527991 RepID=UPI003703C60D
MGSYAATTGRRSSGFSTATGTTADGGDQRLQSRRRKPCVCKRKPPPRLVLQQTEGALARIEAGEYGDCAHCGEPISHERLDAVPYVSLCIGCEQKTVG